MSKVLTRRDIIKTSLIAAPAIVASSNLIMTPSLAIERKTEKRLKLQSNHTGEVFDDVFWAEGKYVEENITKLNKVLRDHRSGEVKDMDKGLFERMHMLQSKLNSHGKTIRITSGYRCAKTNAMLRRRSRGVARNSYHMRGMAIDLGVDGVRLSHLSKAARAIASQCELGGVGTYRSFIHIDMGPRRCWRG